MSLCISEVNPKQVTGCYQMWQLSWGKPWLTTVLPHVGGQKTERGTATFALVLFASHKCNPLVLPPQTDTFPFLTQLLSLVHREKCWLRDKGSSASLRTPLGKPSTLPVPSVKTSLTRAGDGLQIIGGFFHLCHCCCGVNAIKCNEEEHKPSPNHLSQAELIPLAFTASCYLFHASLEGKLWKGKGG